MDNQDDFKLQELQIKTEELALKRWEAENKSYEMWNTYLRDTRSHANGLMRAALIVAGGALTLSVGAFLRDKPPSLTPEQFCLLKFSWVLLTLSMVGVLVVSLILLASSDLHGRRWHTWLKSERREDLKQPTVAPWVTWILGLLTFVCLIGGLGLLAYVAVNGVNNS